jgi:hypothetical protein
LRQIHENPPDLGGIDWQKHFSNKGVPAVCTVESAGHKTPSLKGSGDRGGLYIMLFEHNA